MAANPAAARIRDNQRRSRARRKEYIQDLEARIQRYERQGVDVAIEVQAAARKVARQNAMLRSLLNSFGMTDAKIDEYLSCAAENSNPAPVPRKRPMAAAVERRPTATPIRAEPPPPVCCRGNQDRQKCTTSADEAHFPVQQQACSGTQPQPEATDRSSNPASTTTVDRQWSDDMTPCEEAARIIASMRGDYDEETVRAELGCAPNEACLISNMNIFQALDR
ncbi:hypothetical protein MauCBS54593_006636 [Microsporum audouinii]